MHVQSKKTEPKNTFSAKGKVGLTNLSYNLCRYKQVTKKKLIFKIHQKYFAMKSIKRVLFFLIAIFALHSCALKPIATNYDYEKNNIADVKLSQLGYGEIMIHHAVLIGGGPNGEGKLNMWINGEPMGQMRPREYMIVHLKNGKNELKIMYLSLSGFKITKKFDVEIFETTKVISIGGAPNILHGQCRVTNLLPIGFNKYKFVEQR